MSEPFKILVVDDEKSILKRCVRLLDRQGYEVVGAAESMASLQMIESQGMTFDLMIVDIRMPGIDGLELLERVKAVDPSIEVIMMTGYSTVETAVKAMKNGAYDYLTKPFEVDEFLHVVQNVFEKKALQLEVKDLRCQLEQEPHKRLIFGASPAMNRVDGFIQKVAPVDCNILIMGESGTGKEVVARTIHKSSHLKDRSFVVADCAALSGTLLESELFGHRKGAFTSAHMERKGYFESAHGGTLFLDEVSELPLELQGKLLRAVQEQVIIKVGATRETKVDIRIIASTNRNLEDRVAKGTFREDLFYRLNVVHLTVPPLRDRSEDIPVLANHFLARFTAQFNLPRTPKISQDILNIMSKYDWPGNVRELENAIQRAVVLADNGEISMRDLLPPRALGTISCENPFQPQLSFREMQNRVLDHFTRQYLGSCLRNHNGNITQTAKTLGMRRTSLQRLMKQHSLSSKEFKHSVSD
jgi:DNA-binding NtrC family response regulator